MSIQGYARPQLIIRQTLDRLQALEARTLHACIIGPQYDLFRYTNADEKAAMRGTLFVENTSSDPDDRQLIPYEGLLSYHKVDKDFVRLYGEQLEGQLWQADSHVNPSDVNLYDFQLLGLDTPNKIRVVRRGAVITAVKGGSDQLVSATVVFGGSGYPVSSTMDVDVIGGVGSGAKVRLTVNSSGVVSAGVVISPGSGYTASVTFSAPSGTGINVGVDDETLLAVLHGRPIKTGDIGYFTLGSNTVRRQIRGIEKEPSVAHYGTDADKLDKKLAPADLNPVLTTAASFGNKSAPASWDILLNHTSLGKVKLLGQHTGHTTPPVITVSAPISVGGTLEWPTEQATIETVLEGDTVVEAKVTNPGAGYFEGGIVAVIITDGGSDYSETNPPVMSVSAPADGGIQAVIEPVISEGVIVDYRIIEPGAGYVAQPTITFVGGAPGSGATAKPVANIGSIRSITVNTPGQGYTTDTILTLPGPVGINHKITPSLATAVVETLTISAITVADVGENYEIGDVLSIAGGSNPGSTPSASVQVDDIDGEGGIQAITLLQGGAYTIGPGDGAASVGGNGSGATFNCVMGLLTVKVTNPGVGYTLDISSFTASPAADVAGTITGHSEKPVSLSNVSFYEPVIYSRPDDWNGLLQGSFYNSKYSERYTITVVTGGSGAMAARVKIRSQSGGFSADNVVAYHQGFGYILIDPVLGGLSIELRPPSPGQALRVGDQFTFVVIGKYKPLDVGSSGELIAVNVTAAGSDYTPGTYSLVISAPSAGGVQAVGTATVGGGGTVTGTTITNGGSGYLSSPLITFAAPAGSGAKFEATIATPEVIRDVALVQSGIYTGPLSTRYKITVIKGSDPSDSSSLGGAILRISDSAGVDSVQEIEIEAGVQYPLGTYGLSFVIPENTFGFGPSGLIRGTIAGTRGSLFYSLSTGVVSSISMGTSGEEFGSGYTSVPTVRFTTYVGSGLSLTAVVSSGHVTGVTINNGGTGYNSTLKIGIDGPELYQQGFRTGDVYFVDAVSAQASGPASIMVLAGQATDISGWTQENLETNLFNIDIRSLYSGLITARRNTPPELAYEVGDAAAGGVLLKDTLSLFMADRDEDFQWVPVKNSVNGRLFVHWRGLNPANSADRIRLYQNESEIVAKFGKDDLDNPVCHGAVIAFRGAQEKPIFASRVASDDLAGYLAVFKQAERVEGIYALAPMSMDLAVANAAKDHVEKVSGEKWKLWRRAYVGTANPGSYQIMEVDSDGLNFTATVTSNAQGNVRVVCVNGDFLSRKVAPGDKFRINYSVDDWNDTTYEEYDVQTVLEEDELVLVSGPAVPITPAVKFEIWRADTGRSQALYVGNRSALFSNRRLANIWVDSPHVFDANNNLITVPLFYVAAEMAGLRSAVLPQQGLTYTEVTNSIAGAPLMFTKYTQEDLDAAAALGTFVITQEVEDGPIFIRHQLTTKTDSGVLYYEDSVGTNLDNIAYAIKDIFQPYIGKRNANPETLEEIETKMRDLLDTFKKNPGGFSNIGPALVNWEDLKVEIDPVFRDRINTEVTLELPLPINTLFVTLRATTIQDDTIIAFQLLAAAA